MGRGAVSGFEQVEQWAGELLAKLSPAERRKLARTIAQSLRRSQRQRIVAQRNPDGSAFAPRKPRQEKPGRLRARKMFIKISQAKHLKAKAAGDSAVVEFTARADRIARIHQFGLRDRVASGGQQVRYARRELLGITEAEREQVRDLLIAHLSA